MLHDLRDYARKATSCIEVVDKIRSDSLMDGIVLSIKATFHFCGSINRHVCHILAIEKPDEFTERERDSRQPKEPFSVLCFRSFLNPQLLQDGIFDTVAFRQDLAHAIMPELYIYYQLQLGLARWQCYTNNEQYVNSIT
jgi:hypothetical protein